MPSMLPRAAATCSGVSPALTLPQSRSGYSAWGDARHIGMCDERGVMQLQLPALTAYVLAQGAAGTAAGAVPLPAGSCAACMQLCIYGLCALWALPLCASMQLPFGPVMRLILCDLQT